MIQFVKEMRPFTHWYIQIGQQLPVLSALICVPLRPTAFSRIKPFSMWSALKKRNQLKSNQGEHHDDGEEDHAALFETLAARSLDTAEQPV
jgi:hypothetical protein